MIIEKVTTKTKKLNEFFDYKNTRMLLVIELFMMRILSKGDKTIKDIEKYPLVTSLYENYNNEDLDYIDKNKTFITKPPKLSEFNKEYFIKLLDKHIKPVYSNNFSFLYSFVNDVEDNEFTEEYYELWLNAITNNNFIESMVSDLVVFNMIIKARVLVYLYGENRPTKLTRDFITTKDSLKTFDFNYYLKELYDVSIVNNHDSNVSQMVTQISINIIGYLLLKACVELPSKLVLDEVDTSNLVVSYDTNGLINQVNKLLIEKGIINETGFNLNFVLDMDWFNDIPLYGIDELRNN